MKSLPVGISSFARIREQDYVYVDKTDLLCQLLPKGGYFFLSRPRRFGKTLLVDTIREMLSGRRDLFIGLAAENCWDWEKTYPVIHLSLAGDVVHSGPALRDQLLLALSENARRLDVNVSDLAYVDPNSPNHIFRALITQTYEKYDSRVAVLIDEYDKPLMDNLMKPQAGEIQEELRSFYSVLKNSDAFLHVVFLTGVSKFSHISLFSGLNNLLDITLDPSYTTVCGYTQSELETTFADRLDAADLPGVKQWYNGYSWGGPSVYNPFDILLFLQMGKQYKPYWFSTATPTFLFELMKKKQYYLPRFENFTAGYRDFDVIELGKYELESLLFQTGYLTIKSMTSDVTGVTYQLGFPNTEVQSAFAELALSEYLLTDQPNTTGIKKALLAENIEGIRECVVSLFAGIAHDNYRNNPIANYEGFYASVLYAYLASLGFILIAEDTTSVGRIDLSVQMINRHGQRIVYIFELKTAHDKAEQSMMDDPALRQIKDRRYADKYRHDHATIYLISMIFSRTTKSLVAFNHEITH